MEVSKECLKFNVYDYFNYCKQNGVRRGVGVITDKQSIFYTELVNIDLSSHEWIAMDIENSIHEVNPKGKLTIRMENIHYFSIGKELIIDLPSNYNLTMSQYEFLLEIFDQVKKFNEENNTKTYILIACADEIHFRIYNPYNIDEIIKELQELITKDIRIEDEIIIGKSLPNNIKKENMLFQLNLENCKTINDLIEFFKKAKMYYEDNFYGELLDSIIPNLLEIWDYIPGLLNLDRLQELNIPLTYENLKDQLEMIINKKEK